MDYEQNERKQDSVYSKRLKAGKRRTYFFDVRETRGSDYFLTITESRKRFNDDGYDRHKIFLYKEDFNKFVKALGEAVDHVKTDLMPDYDFDSFSHEYPEEETSIESGNNNQVATAADNSAEEVVAETESQEESTPQTANNLASEEVDKW